MYVPSKDVQKKIAFTDEKGSECVIKIDDKDLTTTLVGGNQLTVARIRGAQRIRSNSETSEQRFDGLLPVVYRGLACQDVPS